MIKSQDCFQNAIRLRDVRLEDKEQLLIWRNSPGVANYMYTAHIIERSEHEKWFSSALQDSSRRYWIITFNQADVGLANLYNIDLANRRCYWAFYLAGENIQGKGIGGLVEFLILEHVFKTMKLHKLCCEVLAFNTRVLELHKRFGFREEGFFQQHILKAGSFLDIHCLAILDEEWEERKEKLREGLQKVESRLTRHLNPPESSSST